jgi:hypothetical protein
MDAAKASDRGSDPVPAWSRRRVTERARVAIPVAVRCRVPGPFGDRIDLIGAGP